MMRCKQVFSVLAFVAPFAVAAVVASPVASSEAKADGSLPILCESTQACEIVPMDEAVLLRDDVCWDGERTTMMGEGECDSGRPYHLTFGYVIDPITNDVLAQSPAIDTCVAGYCVADQLDPGTLLADGVACCNPKSGQCTAPEENDYCPVGDVTWCKQIEENGDGTITCHE